jgi:hypothetical protein
MLSKDDVLLRQTRVLLAKHVKQNGSFGGMQHHILTEHTQKGDSNFIRKVVDTKRIVNV